MKIASLLLREYNLGLTPLEIYERMTWLEIMTLLHSMNEYNNTIDNDNNKNGETTRYENGKTVRIKTKPVQGSWNYFNRAKKG